MQWIHEIKRAKRLSQALVHFVIDRANLFADQRMSGLPMRVRYDISEQFVSKLLRNGWRLCATAVLFYFPIRKILPLTLSHVLPCPDTT